MVDCYAHLATGLYESISCNAHNFKSWLDLRHTWATWQRQAGTPTHGLQRLGGWKTGSMVERYAHLAPDQLVHVVSRLNLIFVGYDFVTVRHNEKRPTLL